MTEKTKSLCSGCRDDYYNQNQEGGCWSFAGAKIVERLRVGIWQPPPYEWWPETCLSCFRPDGFVMLERDDARVIDPVKTEGATE